MTIMDLFRGVRLADPHYDMRFTPTGIPEINAMTRGLPQGKIVEISGEAASGKTALALNLACQTDQPAVILSSEPVPPSNYLAAFEPVCSASMISTEGRRIESAISTLLNLLRSETIKTVVLDSIDMLVSDESAIMSWTRYLPQLMAELDGTDKTLIVVSQLRFHQDAMHSRDMSIMEVTGRAALRIRTKSYDFAKRTGKCKVMFASYPTEKKEFIYAVPFTDRTGEAE